MLLVDDIIVNEIEKELISIETNKERNTEILIRVMPINYSDLNSVFLEKEKKHLVSFSIASNDDLKMSLKYYVYMNSESNSSKGCCFVIRLDINPSPHRNPYLNDYEEVKDFLQRETKDFYRQLLFLLTKYSGYKFKQSETHCHLLISEENSCSRWAFPLEEVITLFGLENNLFKELISNKVLEKNNNNISSLIKDFVKVINLIGFIENKENIKRISI